MLKALLGTLQKTSEKVRKLGRERKRSVSTADQTMTEPE